MLLWENWKKKQVIFILLKKKKIQIPYFNIIFACIIIGVDGTYYDLLFNREVLPSKFNRPDIYYGFLVKMKDEN